MRKSMPTISGTSKVGFQERGKGRGGGRGRGWGRKRVGGEGYILRNGTSEKENRKQSQNTSQEHCRMMYGWVSDTNLKRAWKLPCRTCHLPCDIWPMLCTGSGPDTGPMAFDFSCFSRLDRLRSLPEITRWMRCSSCPYLAPPDPSEAAGQERNYSSYSTKTTEIEGVFWDKCLFFKNYKGQKHQFV